MGLNSKNQTRSEKKLLKVVILSYFILGSPQMDTVSKLVSANLSLHKKPFTCICDRMQMSIS